MINNLDLKDIKGIGEKTANKFEEVGINNVEDLANINVDELLNLNIKGIGRSTALNYIMQAKITLEKNKNESENLKNKSLENNKPELSKILSQDRSKRYIFKIISKFINQSYIKIEEKDSRNDILDNILINPINAFKFLNQAEIKFLKESLGISKIGDLIRYKNKNLYNYISSSQLKNWENDGNNVKELLANTKKSIIISSLLSKLKYKSIEIESRTEKIIVAGLDRAGKTALIKTFGGEYGIDELTKLKPTQRIQREKIKTDNLNVFIWDFGGQTRYRKEYLKDPGFYFLDVTSLIYVIDVQDYERFEETFEYFRAILNALINLEEKPPLIIFLHKVDPDIKSDPEIKLFIEFLKETLKEILIEKGFIYEIYITSIYSFISNEPRFTSFLKKMVTNKSLIADPTSDKIDEIGRVLENALNSIITLSSSISQQNKSFHNTIESLEKRIIQLENKHGINHTKSYPSQQVKTIQNGMRKSFQQEIGKDDKILNVNSSNKYKKIPKRGGISARNAVLDELKELFESAKYKAKS